MSKSENIEMAGRCLEAAKMYLRRKGMDILNEEPFVCEHGSIAIVANSPERGIVFVDVVAKSSDGSTLDKGVGKVDRDVLEEVAIAYLATHEVADSPVVFDQITVVVYGESRAFIRHHINCLN